MGKMHDAENQQALKALVHRSDRRGLIQLVGHLGLLTVTGWLVLRAGGTAWLLPAWVAHGVVLVFLFAPLHETVHYTPFRTRRLNEVVAAVCGALLVLPRIYFRAFHLAHHRFTQDPERDPELAAAKPATLGEYLLYVSGFPYWRRQIGGLIEHALGRVDEPFIARHRRSAVVREARLLLALYAGVFLASVATGSLLALQLWIVPVILGQPFLRLYLLAEHTGCPYIPDVFRNTRTTFSTRFVRRLAWNMPYHTAHHANAAVPFHALPAAHAQMEARMAELAPGYIAVHRGLISDLGNPQTAAVEPSSSTNRQR